MTGGPEPPRVVTGVADAATDARSPVAGRVGTRPETDPEALYARLYDARGVGWPDELELYRSLASAAASTGRGNDAVLEVACGTGRIALDLAAHGHRVAGFDRSASMIDVARAKSDGGNPRWFVGDMRTVELPERFGLVLVPAHSFQFLLTPDDQVAALRRIHGLLRPGGLVCLHIDHPDPGWIASLAAVPHEPTRGQAIAEPGSGTRYRLACAWSYERASQTATAHLAWERLGTGDEVLDRVEMAPMPLRVVGRAEMEHALHRTGFAVEALYGDFARGPFLGSSSEMVWLARRG